MTLCVHDYAYMYMYVYMVYLVSQEVYLIIYAHLREHGKNVVIVIALCCLSLSQFSHSIMV